jgi:DNA-binding Lrp family transcriptional regulator
VAQIVSAQPEVNHNYEREHELNLWFVATAATQGALDDVLARIGRLAGLDVIALPLVEEFHIDLGFDLETGAAPRRGSRVPAGAALDDEDFRLVAAVQGGLEMVPEPYAALAARAGLSAVQVLDRLRQWLEDGVARRIGVVLRHDSLGYKANAMAVWDVPDADVSQAGARMARHPEVTLCYRRDRVLPRWRYNLFCMLHGRDRSAVEKTLQHLARREGLDGYPHAVLFSTQCFKQRGARYAETA